LIKKIIEKLSRGNLIKPHTKETQASLTSEMALQILKEGNERFKGASKNSSFQARQGTSKKFERGI